MRYNGIGENTLFIRNFKFLCDGIYKAMRCDSVGSYSARHRADMEPGDEPAEPVQLSSIQVLHKSMDEVEDNMKGNIEGMIRNQEKTEDLIRKSEIMKDTAQDFKRTSDKVSTHYCLKNVKLIVVVVVVVLVIVLIIVLLASGVIPTSSGPPAVTPTTRP